MIYGDEVERFVADQLGFDRGFGPSSAIGFVEGGEIVAGVIYHNWHPEGGVIEISAASSQRKWLNRSRLSVIFGYPFDQIKCRMVVARIGEHNARARRIWRSLGAREYAIPELRSPHEAEIVYTLTADQWRSGKFAGADLGETDAAKTARSPRNFAGVN
jgi:RimJ/RimL family protein N-acetyltransferase